MKWPCSLRTLLLVVLPMLMGRAEASAGPTDSLAIRQQIQKLLATDSEAAAKLSRQLIRAARRPRALAEGYRLLGAALRNQSRYDSSVYYGQQALRISTAEADDKGQASAYTLLAQTYKRLADAQHVEPLTRKALAYAGQAVTAARRAGQPIPLSRAYLAQGIIYRDLHAYDSARVCYQRAMALARQEPTHPSPLPVAYANYGQLLMDADHDFAGAITWFRRTLPLYRQEDNLNGLEHAYRNLSWAYRRQGRPGPAMHAADTCLVLGRASNDPHRLMNSLQAAYLAYRAASRFPQALALLEELKTRTDSLANADMARAVATHQATYELAQQQARIALLDQANTQQRQQLWTLGLGTALLLGLLGVAAVQSRTIRRTNAQLHTTNQTVRLSNERLAEQGERLALLLREVHHRVKNNLAIVAGLLRLQASRLADPEAARAVRQSQQRVEALSLVHQGLYQTDDVTAVDLRRYVADLVQSLSTAYGFTSDDFDLTLAIIPLRLDLDVAVPLGLILNELLTNAFKYALAPAPGHRPCLRVALGPTPAGLLLLEVQDNGPGYDAAATSQGRSFGQRLMAALAGQLGGELTVDCQNGCHCRLTLPEVAHQ